MAAPTINTGDIPSATTFNEWFVNVHFVRKTATETISNTTTLHNDADLFLAVTTSAIYDVTLIVRYGAQTADDFKIGFTGPTGYSFDYVANGIDPSGTAFTGDQTALFTTGTSPAFGGLGGTNAGLYIRGLLVTASTAGTFQLQWAQNSASVSGTSALANSYMLLRRVS